MADSSKLLMLAGAGAAVWWFYFRDGSTTPAAPAASGAGAPAGGGAAPPPAPPAPPIPPVGVPKPPAPTVDTIQARTIAAANLPAGGTLSMDDWGWHLNNVLAAAGLPAAPDPMPVFAPLFNIGGFTRGSGLDAYHYWLAMAPALRSQLGLSGLGLYGFGRFN